MKSYKKIFCVFLVAGLLASSAWAEDTEETTQKAVQNEPIVMDTITVEARRRAESAFEVPVSTTVMTRGQIELERILNIEDLARRMPSFTVSSFGDDPRSSLPIMRGVGALSTVLAPDNSTVPTIVDGVPLPGFAGTGQLLDIEQTEVLRGPQGTLFGRNSTGGAVVINSVTPDGEPERTLVTELGSDWHRLAEMRLGGTVAENLFGRLALRYAGQESYIDNQQPDEGDIGGFDIGAARGALRWIAGDATEVNLIGTLEIDRRDTGYVSLLRDADAFQDQPSFNRDTAGVTLKVQHDLDSWQFNSITGFQYYDYSQISETSDGFLFNKLFGLPPAFFINDGELGDDEERENQYFQEFTAVSLPGSEIGWIAGAVFSYNDYNSINDRASSLFATNNGLFDNNLETTSYAVFGDVSIPFANRFEVGAGLRYTHEEENFVATYVGNGAPGTVAAFSQDSTRRFDLFTGRLSLGYRPTDDSIVFASISRGAKAGGFPRFPNNAPLGVPEPGYDESLVWAYELGARAELLDGRLSISTAGFFNDLKDEAALVFDTSSFTFPVENIDLETYGIEADINYVLPHGFDITAAVAWTEGELTGLPVNSASGGEVGNDIPNVPRFAGSLTLGYRSDRNVLGMGKGEIISGFVGYRYTGRREADFANSFKLDAQNVIDAQVGIVIGDAEFYVFGDNLIGDRLEQQGNLLGPGAENVLVSRGRTIGAGMKLYF